MKFSDFKDSKESAYDVFRACHDLVFSDGETENLEHISAEARLVYLLWCFDGEVHNGGFDQLFFNSLGDHCVEILQGLKMLNAKHSSALLEKALCWFPDSKPSSNRHKRWKQLEPYRNDQNYERELEKLNDQFYQYKDNLVELLNNYVKDNGKALVHSQRVNKTRSS